jgi:hypothetical protein
VRWQAVPRPASCSRRRVAAGGRQCSALQPEPLRPVISIPTVVRARPDGSCVPRWTLADRASAGDTLTFTGTLVGQETGTEQGSCAFVTATISQCPITVFPPRRTSPVRRSAAVRPDAFSNPAHRHRPIRPRPRVRRRPGHQRHRHRRRHHHAHHRLTDETRRPGEPRRPMQRGAAAGRPQARDRSPTQLTRRRWSAERQDARAEVRGGRMRPPSPALGHNPRTTSPT